LWPERHRRSTWSFSTSTGTLPTAWVASAKSSTPFSWHSAPISRIGFKVPISLFAQIRATRIVSGRRASRTISTGMRPVFVGFR
jgi:hypothetical protein